MADEPQTPAGPLDDLDEYESELDPLVKACGNCRLWKVSSRDAGGRWVGTCRVMTVRGLFGPEAPICSSFLSRAQAIPQVLPEAKRRQPMSRPLDIAPTVIRHGGAPAPEPRPAPSSAPPAPRPPPAEVRRPAPHHPDADPGEDFDMTREELKQIIREAMNESDVQLAQKWEGGTVVIKPHDPALQPKEIEIDALFHKVVMVRDRLRVLEQKVNAHPKLSDAEKVEMQQYVTRCYGSLTTFNALFRDKSDFFVGDKSDG